MEFMPQELDELQRKTMQLQIEETALKKEKIKRRRSCPRIFRTELALRCRRKGLLHKREDEKAERGARMPRFVWRSAKLDLEQAI